MWVWDILEILETFSLLQHLLILPLTSSYLLLSLPPTLLLWYGLVRGNLKKLWDGWDEPWDLLLPSTFSSSNLFPPPSYSSQLLLPPPKPPPNSSYLLLKGILLRKVLWWWWWWWRHCNYRVKLQVQVSY